MYTENIDLSDMVADLTSEEHSEAISTKDGLAYAPEIRKLYYSLLADEIPAAKVAKIVRTVLKTFKPSLDVDSIALPQKSCASYMRKDELTTVSNAHKATVLSESSSFHLNTDGTTKKQKIAGVVINDVVISVNEVSDGAAITAIEDISSELKKLRETAQALGMPNATSINWTLFVSSSSDSASTQKLVNKLIEENREKDREHFGEATSDAIEIVKSFCSMHLGVNLRKAFLCGTDTGDDDSKRHHRVDTFVHEFSKLFGKHGVPEYTCGVQSFPDFLALMVAEGSSELQYF